MRLSHDLRQPHFIFALESHLSTLKMEKRKIIHLEEPNTLSNFLTQEERENIVSLKITGFMGRKDFVEVIYDDFSDIDNKKNKIDDELIQGCKRFLDELKREEREKKKKEEEERKALEEREARRKYWAKKLFSHGRQTMTLIIPKDSKLKK